MAVVAPHGVLFRSGTEGKIREKLIRDNALDAVVGLPAQLFPTTGIPVCIMIFDRYRLKVDLRLRLEGVDVTGNVEVEPVGLDFLKSRLVAR